MVAAGRYSTTGVVREHSSSSSTTTHCLYCRQGTVLVASGSYHSQQEQCGRTTSVLPASGCGTNKRARAAVQALVVYVAAHPPSLCLLYSSLFLVRAVKSFCLTPGPP